MSIKSHPADSRRSDWLSTLAQTDPQDLDAAWDMLEDKPSYQFLRKPEVGMIMVQGRAGNTGKRFNFGEMTITRCVVQTSEGCQGFGYVAGSKPRTAERIAVLDAMLQDPALYEELNSALIEPMARRIEAQKEQVAKTAGATRVNFFTMPRTRTGK